MATEQTKILRNLNEWKEQWLTKNRNQHIMENHVSSILSLKSAVPQGTVLGPLMFLLRINDIDENISSTIWLFTDDCVV